MRSRAAAARLGLTLASAVLLSGLGVTTQLAFDAGATVGTLLSGRFLVAAVILWPLVWLLQPQKPARRQVLAGLLLGVGYTAHAWLFSMSLARLDAGSRLVHQGAKPDAFFVIERGRASVERDERHVADLGGDDFFGELPRLRRSPRTAKVVAATDMRVRVMRRGDFMDAMRRLPTLASSVREAALAR